MQVAKREICKHQSDRYASSKERRYASSKAKASSKARLKFTQGQKKNGDKQLSYMEICREREMEICKQSEIKMSHLPVTRRVKDCTRQK